MTEKIEEQHIDIVEHFMPNFVSELVRHIEDGWQVSQTNPGDALINYGSTYVVSLYRNQSTVDRAKRLLSEVEAKPRMSREEAAANAREAMRVKRESKKEVVATLETEIINAK